MNDPLEGLRVRVVPMGCRTNIFESESLSCSFSEAGAEVVPDGGFDVAVLMTCSVTAEADRKCRQMIRRLRRESPGGLIVASGCWAQKVQAGHAGELGVDCLVGNRIKSRIPDIVRELLLEEGKQESPRVVRVDVQADHGWDPLFLSRPQARTRAFVKIQDGCDHRCSYCIIPDLRGRPVERPPQEILEEVRKIASSGCPEVIFTGINIGMYGKSSGASLGEVIKRAGMVPGIKRIRLGSIEPFALSEELLGDLSGTSKFCPHLHLPLQSGDAGILRKMNRGYTPQEFKACVSMARRFLGDDLHVSTDVIVGFPGESEEAFDSTLGLLESAGIGRVHVFPFSPREGTPAALLEGRVPPEVKNTRRDKALVAGSVLLEGYSSKWPGREVEVLVETNSNGICSGLSRHFLRVEAASGAMPGEVILLTPDSSKNGVLHGKV